MQIIKPYFVIETPICGEDILKHIEKAGRTAYKTEDKISSDSARKFVKKILDMGHESVIDTKLHSYIN
ncbi:MAG: FAD-dependent thymidylate synthase [Actinobacteria bacterium]|nr:FAD-dependent thymidylate synthase [Actinomycetota bacterium]